MKQKGLGRGLDAIFGTDKVDHHFGNVLLDRLDGWKGNQNRHAVVHLFVKGGRPAMEARPQPTHG